MKNIACVAARLRAFSPSRRRNIARLFSEPLESRVLLPKTGTMTYSGDLTLLELEVSCANDLSSWDSPLCSQVTLRDLRKIEIVRRARSYLDAAWVHPTSSLLFKSRMAI